MGDFKKIKLNAWDYYKKWMQERTFSKILNQEIKVTRLGWEHITRGSRIRPRNLVDSKRRIYLLKAAKYVIRTATVTYTETRNTHLYYILEGFFAENKKVKTIRVVLKKDSSGRLTFFSVMGK